MTPTTPGAQPPPADLTARVFRALYPGYDLHTAGGTHIAVPKGTACLIAPALGEIARQIAARQAQPPAEPDVLHGPADHQHP